jgi:hypothetical protein
MAPRNDPLSEIATSVRRRSRPRRRTLLGNRPGTDGIPKLGGPTGETSTPANEIVEGAATAATVSAPRVTANASPLKTLASEAGRSQMALALTFLGSVNAMAT